MENILLFYLLVFTLFFLPRLNFGKAPSPVILAGFAPFRSLGNVDVPSPQITGNTGSNAGGVTGLGNTNGQAHVNDGLTLQHSSDIAAAYTYLGASVPTFFPAPAPGNGQNLSTGIYSLSGPATPASNLNSNVQNNPGAVFILKISGGFSTVSGASVTLLNGTRLCNAFWKIDGAATVICFRSLTA